MVLARLHDRVDGQGASPAMTRAPADGFDFLGYTFGPRYGRKGERCLSLKPPRPSSTLLPP